MSSFMVVCGERTGTSATIVTRAMAAGQRAGRHLFPVRLARCPDALPGAPPLPIPPDRISAVAPGDGTGRRGGSDGQVTGGAHRSHSLPTCPQRGRESRPPSGDRGPRGRDGADRVCGARRV